MGDNLELIVKYEGLLFQTRYESWSNNVFTIRWWILIGCLTIPWFIWYMLIDKKRIQEMFLYSFATLFIALLLDETGSSLTLWAYPVKIVPFFPRLITANFTLVPIIFSLVYQCCPKWKSFIIANVVLTIVFSFVIEPMLVWGKLYVLIKWKHIYSIPVYFFSAIFLKLFMEKIKSIQLRYKGSY